MVSFSCVYTVYTTLGAAIGPLTEKFGYGSGANSIFGSSYIAGGLIWSFIHAFLLDKYSRYKIQYIFIGLASTAALGGLTGIIGLKIQALTIVMLFLMGFAQIPIIGVSYSFWAELTYPINEALSWGLLQLFGSVVATIFTFIASFLIQKGKPYYAFYTLIGLSIIGTICKCSVREILKKKRAGIRGTGFSFHVGNQSFNEVAKSKSPNNFERRPLIDEEENGTE